MHSIFIVITASLGPDLHQVDNCELVVNFGASVLDLEVEPLGVFVGVQVISQPQFILILGPASSLCHPYIHSCNG